MASTTIHTLSYKMVADTQQFTRGLISTRSEIALMKKLMGDTSPEDKAAKALEMIQRLYDNGKISAERYKAATAEVERELKQVQFAASNAGKAVAMVNTGMAKIGAIAKSGIANLAAMAGGYLSISRIATNITDQFQRIDQIQDLAEQLDSSASSLLKMQYALQRGGGLGADEAADAIKTFSVNISMANMGMGKALKIFEQMGFEADSLAALNLMDPIEKIGIVAEELAKIENSADRLAVITKIFGTGGDKMASFFAGGAGGIAEMVRQAERFEVAVSDIDAAEMAELVELTEDMVDAWAGLGTVLARDVMPTVTAAVRMLTQAIEGSKFLYGGVDMKGQEPLTFMQRMKMNLGIKEAPIGVAGYDIIFGAKPTAEQAKTFQQGQRSRVADLLSNELENAPVIGGYLRRLVELGEQQLNQNDNRNAIE